MIQFYMLTSKSCEPNAAPMMQQAHCCQNFSTLGATPLGELLTIHGECRHVWLERSNQKVLHKMILWNLGFIWAFTVELAACQNFTGAVRDILYLMVKICPTSFCFFLC